MKIMLVDDSRTIRNIQKNVLREFGHTEFIEADDGLIAWRLFQKEAPDLMLVDGNMPNMDGITLIRKIRETNKTVPIIMCSTDAEKSTILEAIKAGVNNYIVKPFSVESLHDKLNQTLSKIEAGA